MSWLYAILEEVSQDSPKKSIQNSKEDKKERLEWLM